MPINTSISFGLVHIPITLSNVVRSNSISFNQLHKKSNRRIRYKKVIGGTNEEVKSEDIVKGYEYDDDKYVIFTENDFEKIKTEKDKTITIEQFIDIREIDPIYYEKSYYAVPASGADKAYKLLVEAMDEEGRVGIAKTVMSEKDTLISIRAKNGTLIMSTLHFAAEIQRDPVKLDDSVINESELKLGKMLIESMTKPFAPQMYHDEYRARVEAAIKQKIAGQEVVAAPTQAATGIVDLMSALQQSLKDVDIPSRPILNIPQQNRPTINLPQ